MRLKLISEDVTDRMLQNLAGIASSYFSLYMANLGKKIDVAQNYIDKYKSTLDDLFEYVELHEAKFIDPDTNEKMVMPSDIDVNKLRSIKDKIVKILRNSDLDRQSLLYKAIRNAMYKLEVLETSTERDISSSTGELNRARMMMGLRAAVKNHLSNYYAVKSIRHSPQYIMWGSYSASLYARQYELLLRERVSKLRLMGYKITYGPFVEIRTSDEVAELRFNKYYTFDLQYYLERHFEKVKSIIRYLEVLLEQLTQVAEDNGDQFTLRLPSTLKALMMGNDCLIISSANKSLLEEYDAVVIRWMDELDLKPEQRNVRSDEGFDIAISNTSQYISHVDILAAAVANTLEENKEEFMAMSEPKKRLHLKKLITVMSRESPEKLVEMSKMSTDIEAKETIIDLMGTEPPVVGKAYIGINYEGIRVKTGRVAVVSPVDEDIYRFRTIDNITYDVVLNK